MKRVNDRLRMAETDCEFLASKNVLLGLQVAHDNEVYQASLEECLEVRHGKLKGEKRAEWKNRDAFSKGPKSTLLHTKSFFSWIPIPVPASGMITTTLLASQLEATPEKQLVSLQSFWQAPASFSSQLTLPHIVHE